MDVVPHKFDLHAKAQLLEMALLASAHIDERRRTLKSHLSYFSTMAHNLRSPLNGLELCFEAMYVKVWLLILLFALKLCAFDSNFGREKPPEQWIWEQTKSNLNLMKKIVEKGLAATKRASFFDVQTLNPKKIAVADIRQMTVDVCKLLLIVFRVWLYCQSIMNSFGCLFVFSFFFLVLI